MREEDWHSADLNSSWYGRCVRERLRTCRDSRKIIACISNDGRATAFSLLSLSSRTLPALCFTGMDAERSERDTRVHPPLSRLHFTGGMTTVFIVMREQCNFNR